MTEPDDVAIDALRRFDQPHELDPASVSRIEERMLGRFDEVAATQPPDVHRIEETVELRSVDTAPTSRRLRSTRLGLAAAAVIVVLGAIVFLRSGAGDPEEVPSTQPSVPTDDQGRVAEQLQEYCVEFVMPLTEASALWVPLGFQSEERADVLVAVEQAAQGLVDLTPPAASQFGERDLELLDLATEARRAVTLGPGGDEAVALARDEILSEIDTAAADLDVAACDLG